MKFQLSTALLLLSIVGISPSWAYGADGAPSAGVSAPSNASPGDAATDYQKLRDPFKEPFFHEQVARQRSPLEQFPVSDFSMIGVLQGLKGTRAILKTKEGKIFIVSTGMKIGIHDGRIRRISDDRVFVDEVTTDVLGGRDTAVEQIPLVAHDSVGVVSLPQDLPAQFRNGEGSAEAASPKNGAVSQAVPQPKETAQ